MQKQETSIVIHAEFTYDFRIYSLSVLELDLWLYMAEGQFVSFNKDPCSIEPSKQPETNEKT